MIALSVERIYSLVEDDDGIFMKLRLQQRLDSCQFNDWMSALEQYKVDLGEALTIDRRAIGYTVELVRLISNLARRREIDRKDASELYDALSELYRSIAQLTA